MGVSKLINGKRAIFGIMLVLALVFISANASAETNWSFWYSSHGFLIEAYHDGYWDSGYGYLYYGDGWYYWDYPYRYHYSGTWYTFEPGWYSYSAGWHANPYYGYYDYYPPSYVYSGGVWQYQPSWYYNPVYLDGYGYGYGPPGGAGVSFFHTQTANCGQAKIGISDVSVLPGTSKTIYAHIKNESNYNFEIISAGVYEDSFDVDAGVVGYDEIVRPNEEKTIEIEVSADRDAKGGAVDASLHLTGQFADGKYCNVSGLGQIGFKIYIHGPTEPQPQGSDWQEYGGTGYSYNYFLPRENTDDYYPPYQYEEENKQEEEVAEFSYEPAANCSALDLVTENIGVQAGGSNYEEFMFKNYNNQKFYFDSIDVYDYSNGFDLEVADSYGYAFENGTVMIKVRAYGNEIQGDAYGTGYIKVKGHFENGYSCSLKEEFYVSVNGEPENECEKFVLNVPNKIEIDGGAGFTAVSFENSNDYAVTIVLEGYKLGVSPEQIEIPANTAGQRLIEISSFEDNTGVLFYRVSGLQGCEYLDKATTVVKGTIEFAEEEEPGEVLQVVSYASEVDVYGEASIAVTLKNYSNEEMEVSVTITGLPEGFEVTEVSDVLGVGEAKTLFVPVSTELVEGSYSGVLEVNYGSEKITRNITVNAKEEAVENGETEDEDPLAGLANTAFLILTENALNLGLIILALIAIYAIYRHSQKNNNDKKQGWIGD